MELTDFDKASDMLQQIKEMQDAVNAWTPNIIGVQPEITIQTAESQWHKASIAMLDPSWLRRVVLDECEKRISTLEAQFKAL